MRFRRPSLESLGRSFQLIAPALITLATLVALIPVIQSFPPSSTRDALVGSIFGGMVTLLITLTVQQMIASAASRQRADERGRLEHAILSALSSEITIAGTLLEENLKDGTFDQAPLDKWPTHEVQLAAVGDVDLYRFLAVTYEMLKGVNKMLSLAEKKGSYPESARAFLTEIALPYAKKARERCEKRLGQIGPP